MNIKLSIVIVEYHCIDEIMHCVASIKKHLQLPYEIIVSSNSCYNQQEQKKIDQKIVMRSLRPNIRKQRLDTTSVHFIIILMMTCLLMLIMATGPAMILALKP